ncbi:hypothetical protein LINPERPRIM_LOCUS1708 [Linum perenne]
MSYYNQQQPPVGVPPQQGYPKDAYPPPGYPAQGYPPPGYPPQQGYPAPPPPYAPQQQNSNAGCLEGWYVLISSFLSFPCNCLGCGIRIYPKAFILGGIGLQLVNTLPITRVLNMVLESLITEKF